MILIVTHSEDITAELVIRHLNNQNASFIRLNTDRLGTPECHFAYSNEPYLRIGSVLLCASQIQSVWVRRFALPEVLGLIDEPYVEFVRREQAIVLDGFLEAVGGLQMNSSMADRVAGNRLLQARNAAAVGFMVPDTLVTQNVDEARAFLEKYRMAITKAMSFGRLRAGPLETVAYTSVVKKDSDLSGLKVCPALFQEYIEKKREWRVTVVGSNIFSAHTPEAVDHFVIDWRAAADPLAFIVADIPDTVKDKILDLMKVSRIVFGAHDLIETHEGDFFFLETNPAGQWGWLEIHHGLQIGAAVASELVKGG